MVEEDGDRCARVQVSALGALGWAIHNVCKAAWGLLTTLLQAAHKALLMGVGTLILVSTFHKQDAGVGSACGGHCWGSLMYILAYMLTQSNLYID